jgi:hypothetical protein
MLAQVSLLLSESLTFFSKKQKRRMRVIELMKVSRPIWRSTDNLTAMVVYPVIKRRKTSADKFLTKDCAH